MTQVRPTLAPFNPRSSVPDELYLRQRWIGWRKRWDPVKGKWDKLPVCIRTGTGDGFLLPENHVGYDEAAAAVQRLRLSGVGFVLTKGCGVVGGDMDHCVDPATGVFEPWAQVIVDLSETYLEVSPSGTGIRFWALEDAIILRTIKSIPAGVEIYPSGRFLTYTGRHIAGSPLVVQSAKRTLQALMDRVHSFKPAGSQQAQPSTPVDETSDEAFRRYAYKNSPFGKINDAALASLDKWVPDLFPAAEHQPGTGAWRIGQDELGRPDLQEDLSIAPSGITDWGVHDMGDPREGRRSAVDVVLEWGGDLGIEDAKGAAEWLATKLGLPFDSSASDQEAAVQAVPFVTFNPTAFNGRTAPTRRWIVPEWIPVGAVTGVYGDGGTGKSLLMMQLQTATALGKPWLGLQVETVKSLGIYCEDEVDELWRRQEQINGAYFCVHADVSRAEMASRLGEDNLLMTFGMRSSKGELTRFYKQVAEQALDLGVRLVVVDTAADTFGGNENDRGQVRQYVQRALGGLALKIGGAVACCAHPSRAGLSNGTGDSGSTGWSNAFRSRAFLAHVDDDPDARLLARMKANYAPRDASMGLKWRNGVLFPDGAAVGPGVRMSSSGVTVRASDVFVDLLRDRLHASLPVSLNPAARNYAPHVFGGLMREERQGFSKQDFKRVMEELFRAGRIVNVAYKNKGSESFKLELPVKKGHSPSKI